MVEVHSAAGSHTSRQVLVELAHCAESDLGTQRWWACVSQQLHRLDEDLGNEDIVGLVEQVTAEVPERLHTAQRIRRLHDSVRREAWQLATSVAHHAGTHPTGDPLAVSHADIHADTLAVTLGSPDPLVAAAEVRAALGVLLSRVGRLYVLADALLLDTYSLDIGGGD